MVSLYIEGEPKGKARPVVLKQGYAFTPKQTVDKENQIRIAYREKYKDFTFGKKPVEVCVIAKYSIPKNASKKNVEYMIKNIMLPTRKPDIDNVAKLVCDALNKYAYNDDSCVVKITAEKVYAKEPCMIIIIKELTTIL